MNHIDIVINQTSFNEHLDISTDDIFIDGKPIPANLSGADVKSGKLIFSDSKLYTLFDTKGKAQTHMLEVRFQDPGFRGYAFTFGS